MQVCERPVARQPVSPGPVMQRRGKIVWLIQNDPPPTPLCFDDRRQWQDYLHSLHESGEKITRVQDTGYWTVIGGVKVRQQRFLATVWERVDYCSDCHIGGTRQLRMQATGRCILPKTE
jgi:hypothetical protein